MSLPPALPAKLIFNPASGTLESNPVRLLELLRLLQAQNIQPEVFVVTPEVDDITRIAEDAVQRGFSLVIACGGDGTIESAANALVDTQATLGILPVGTQNNLAASLSVPLDLGQAVQLLRTGRRRRIDACLAVCGERRRWFLEALTIGLFSALFQDADAIQKGEITRVGDLLAKFIDFPSAKIHLNLSETSEEVVVEAHAVIGVNMPLIGGHFHLAADIAYDDGVFDLFLYDQLSKLDLIGYGFDLITGLPGDPRIQRLRARQVRIHTEPPMPVMADGFLLGEGPVEVRLNPLSLNIIAGEPKAPGEATAPALAAS